MADSYIELDTGYHCWYESWSGWQSTKEMKAAYRKIFKVFHGRGESISLINCAENSKHPLCAEVTVSAFRIDFNIRICAELTVLEFSRQFDGRDLTEADKFLDTLPVDIDRLHSVGIIDQSGSIFKVAMRAVCNAERQLSHEYIKWYGDLNADYEDWLRKRLKKPTPLPKKSLVRGRMGLT